MKHQLKAAAGDLGGGIRAAWQRFFPAAAGKLPGEKGGRVATDVDMERLYRQMWVDVERRHMIRQIRDMDARDGRVKAVHGRLARDCIRGGLVLQVNERHSSETLKREWLALMGRVQLDNAEKLKSDARGIVMEGNLPLQLVFNDRQEVVAGIRMPSDTIVPITAAGGRFKDPGAAYEQRDVMTGQVLASWAAWQLVLGRLDPDNFDDLGAMGRPFLDSCVGKWQQLTMTEEDMVIRRRMRAPQRLLHVYEGATPEELEKYRKDHYNEQGQIGTDFFMNRKGSVSAVQGDSHLDEIADVVHLLDSFYAGGPGPKALFGYAGDVARDVVEDFKRIYYEEVDALQDAGAICYAVMFRMHLLFKGIDPGPEEFTLRYRQRRTETANQVADLALKHMALGLPWDEIWRDMGRDPDRVRAQLEQQARRHDPYPLPAAGGAGTHKVSVTPGNAPKGESATTVNNPGSHGGKGRSK